MEIHKHFPVIKINANGQKPPVKRQDFLDCIFFKFVLCYLQETSQHEGADYLR